MLNFLQKDGDISHLSNFKTKAKTKYFFEIKNLEDVEKIGLIYDFAKTQKLQVLVVGWGTNMLFAFDVYNGIIIKNSLDGYLYDKKTKELIVYSNHSIRQVAQELEKKYNQKIWHRFIGLPGSVWGAIYGNAGCFGLETESNLTKVDVYNIKTKSFERFHKADCEFEYRESFFKKNKDYFIIKWYFDLSKLYEKYSSDVDNIKFREEIQPKWNSCGSFFKNPSKEFSAGKLIEQVGLKWFVHGNAYFSEKHANFLMTKEDGWDYRDLVYLINLAQVRVKQETGIDITPEVQIIKNKDV